MITNKFHVAFEANRVDISGPVDGRLRLAGRDGILEILRQADDRAIDLLCIAAGAYALDRIYTRKVVTSELNEIGLRDIQVCFHVSDISFWQQPSVTSQISDLLHFLSGDYWSVSFMQHARAPMESPQDRLNFKGASSPDRVALYSGGLDSAAGVACEMLQKQANLMLFTVGHQTSIRKNCEEQIRQLRSLLPEAAALYHASLVTGLEGAGIIRDQETSQRVRGFLFCSLAAIYAAQMSIAEIDLYENGHGAINLPLDTGALSDGLATRGAHPGFLFKMSGLASAALKFKVSFNLPYLQFTKSQMVSKLAAHPHLLAWAQQSRSCVHTSWREPGVDHCGKCPACLERRQAFIAAGVTDEKTRYSKDIFNLESSLDDDYLRAYLDNAYSWIKGSKSVIQRLKDHLILSDLKHFGIEPLIELHRNHALEVLDTFRNLLPSSTAPKELQVVA